MLSLPEAMQLLIVLADISWIKCKASTGTAKHTLQRLSLHNRQSTYISCLAALWDKPMSLCLA